MRKTVVERLVEAHLLLAGVTDPEVMNRLMETHFNECVDRQQRKGTPHRNFDADPAAAYRALVRMGFELTPSETAAHMNLFETAHSPQSLSNL